MTTRFNPPTGWPQLGRAFNHGIVQPEGKVLHMTGQVAWDGAGNLIGGGDCEKQVLQCFDNVEHILRAVGGQLDDIISLTSTSLTGAICRQSKRFGHRSFRRRPRPQAS